MPLTIQDTGGANKFTVASDTGNTVVAGTLTVTGATTLSTLGVADTLTIGVGTEFTITTDVTSVTTFANNVSDANVIFNVMEGNNVTTVMRLDANPAQVVLPIVDINAGTIDGTTIGDTTKASGGFTAVTIDSNNTSGAALMISNSTAQTAGTDLVRITGYQQGQVTNALHVDAGDVTIADRLYVSGDLTAYGGLCTNAIGSTNGYRAINISNNVLKEGIEGTLKVWGSTQYYQPTGTINAYFTYNSSNQRLSGGGGGGGDISIWSECSILTQQSIIADNTWNPSDIRIKKNITDIDENDALQIIRKIKSRKYNLRDETKDRNSRYGFIAQELKECLPEAVSMMREFIPSELRVCNNVSWTTITDSSGNTNHKLTIHDLNDSSGNQAYRFYVSNDISGNDEGLKDIVSLEDDPQSFIFDAKYKNIFIYGKQVHDFLTVDKSVLITMVIPVIQNMDKVQQEEKTKLAFTKAKISVLESENKELKARLTSIEARLNAAGI